MLELGAGEEGVEGVAEFVEEDLQLTQSKVGVGEAAHQRDDGLLEGAALQLFAAPQREVRRAPHLVRPACLYPSFFAASCGASKSGQQSAKSQRIASIQEAGTECHAYS